MSKTNTPESTQNVTVSPQSETVTSNELCTVNETCPICPHNGDCEQTDRILTEVMLDKLPQNVVRPTGQPDKHTSQRTAEQLQWAMGCRAKWKDSPEYAEVIYRLLTMTVEELKEAGHMVPAWKLKQEVT